MASRERTIENKIKFYENKIVASETLKNYFKKLIKMFNLVKITSAKKYTL